MSGVVPLRNGSWARYSRTCFPASSRAARVAGSRASRLPLRCPHSEDPVEETQFERSPVAHAEVSGVCHRVDRDQCLQTGRIAFGHGVLRATHVRSADHGEAAVAPGLLHEPLGGVVAVVHVVGHHVPDAFRGVAASRVLAHHNVTMAHERKKVVERLVLVVRCALQDGGEFALQPGAVPAGEIDVRGKPHAIAHGHHDVFRDDVGRRTARRRALPGSQDKSQSREKRDQEE